MRKNGEKLLLSWTAFFDKESGITYATARDITRIRQIEKSLVEKESHLKTLIQTIPDLIWLKNIEGIYLSCNSAFERFFGKKEADIVGKTDFDFVNKELATSFRENDNIALLAKKPMARKRKETARESRRENFSHGLFKEKQSPLLLR